MTDIFLEDRSANRSGCLRLLVVALIIGAVAFLIYKGCSGKEEPAGEPPASDNPVDTDPRTSELLAPDQPAGTGTATPTPPPGSSGAGTGGDKSVAAGAASNPDSVAALNQAKQYLAQKNYTQARSKGFDALNRAGNQADKSAAEAFLGDLHIQMITTQMPMEEKIDYRIKSGDLVSKLSRTYKTTDQLLMKSNGIRDPSRIQIGDGLRILTGTFTIRIDKSDNEMLVLLNNRFFKRYKVGTGEYNKTPVGTFKVKNRMIEPDWWRPDGQKIPYGDPEHLLGTRWIGLNIKSYGIHGIRKDEVDTIGTQSSAGCIRMLNPEVEELYDYIPLGTEVIIQD